MGFDEGRIVLNSDTGIYYTGQTVFGKLIFDQEKEKNFRGIYVKLKGFCYVHWQTRHTRTVNGKRETYHVDHTSREEYVNQKIYLIGSESGECRIQAGHYEYPFQVAIPNNCPSSFEGTHGHIRYELKAVVDRAFKMDQEKKVAVRVIATLDLNTEPGAKNPLHFEFDESYYCCCTRSGTVKAVLKLPHCGYVPGQTIPIEMGIENNGSVAIDCITFTLKKDTKFHAQGTKTDTEDVAQLQLGEVLPNTSRSSAAELLVPYVDTPNVRQCRYIDVDYRLKVTLVPDGCHRKSSLSRNIIIGTIPVAGSNYSPSGPNQMPDHNVAVVNQPVASQYPGANPPYPGANAYPSNTPYPGPAVSPYHPEPAYPTGNDHPQYPPPYTANPPAPYPTANSPFEKSSYPGAPTVTPYPISNATSEKSTYPGAPNVTSYPPSNAPYPTSNSPYPPSNAPNPTSNSAYPPANSPYPPSTAPYPTSNSPYPPSTVPIPTSNSPYPPANPTSNAPYPASNAPYPTSPSPMPPTSAAMPAAAPGAGVSGLRTGTFGFIGQAAGNSAAMPRLPQGAVPYPLSPAPNPFAAASAPPPGTPTEEKQ